MTDTRKPSDAPNPDDTHSPDPGVPPGQGGGDAKALPNDDRLDSQADPHDT